jgi:hypothetical protein
MSQLNYTYTDLLGFQIQSPHSIINFYSLNGTGVAGRFVSFETGNQDPEMSAGDFSASTPGAAFDGAISLRYEQPRKVKYAASGETKYSVAGLLLDATVEFDENGQKVLFHPEVQKEKQIVPSGVAVRIATEGVYNIKSNAYTNTPIPGFVGVISNANGGRLAFVPPSAAVIGSGLDVCKVLSTSGTSFGGYAQIQLTLV